MKEKIENKEGGLTQISEQQRHGRAKRVKKYKRDRNIITIGNMIMIGCYPEDER